MPSLILSLAALFPVMLLAAVFFLPLLWSRNGLLLGIHVSPEFFASSEARRIRRSYLKNAALICLCAIALAAIGVASRRPWMWLIAEALEIAGMFFLWIAIWRRLGSHRGEHHAARTALLTPEPRASLSWLLSTLAALLPLAEVAVLLAYRWQAIPSRFPIHWGIDGQPNGWGTRSPALVFGPLVMGAALILLFAFIGELIPRVSAGFSGSSAVLGLTRNVMRAGAWFLGLLFSAIGLMPLMSNPTRMVPWLVVGPMLFAVGLIAWIALRAKRMSREMAAAQDSTPDRYWKAGMFYCNPDDPALMVPKRMGIGYTFNFGHPMAWILLGAFAALPLIASLLPLLSRRH